MNGKKIGYLGPKGTYSEIAAKTLCDGAELKAYPTFFTLFAAIKNGEADAIVLPIENSLNGAVTQNLDLLQESENVCAKCACTVKIEHRLVTLKGADKSRIKRIFSHTQALGQCARFLANNYPNAKIYETSSTAECINKIESAEDAGIIGAHFKREGFELSDVTISDEPNNFTQFLLVEKGAPDLNAVSSRAFFSVTCRHEVGALVGLLGILKDNGINMTEIESRPIKDKTGEFRFFIEVEGNYADPTFRSALGKIEEATLSFKLLGVY